MHGATIKIGGNLFVFLKMLHAKRQTGFFSHLWLILESQRRLLYFSNTHVKRNISIIHIFLQDLVSCTLRVYY